MDNLDQIAAFVFEEEEEIEAFSLSDIEDNPVKEEEFPAEPPVPTNITSLLVEDIGESEDFEEQVLPQEEEKPAVGIDELVVSLAQYGRYWQIEKMKDKGDTTTQDIRIASSLTSNLNNRSTSSSKQDNAKLFVEAYINQTRSTELHIFRAWLTRKDSEFASMDPDGYMRESLVALTSQRDELYALHRNNPEGMQVIIDRLLEVFNDLSTSHNKVVMRFNKSKDSMAEQLTTEIDGIFDKRSEYYQHNVVMADHIVLVSSATTLDTIKQDYTVADSITLDDASTMCVKCSCGKVTPAKDAVQMVRRKNKPYLKVRYVVCPTCGKKVIILREVIVALEQALNDVLTHMQFVPGQMSTVFVGKDELSQAYDYLNMWKQPKTTLNMVNTDISLQAIESYLNNVDYDKFIQSFLDTLEMQSLNVSRQDTMHQAMHYLTHINGLDMRLQTQVHLMYSMFATDEAKIRAEINRNKAKEDSLHLLKDTFKELSQDKMYGSFILSPDYLGASFLKNSARKFKKEATPSDAEIHTLVDHMMYAINYMSFEEYQEHIAVEVNPDEVHFSRLGVVIEDFLSDPEIQHTFVEHMFDQMFRAKCSQKQVYIRLPDDTLIRKEISNGILSSSRGVNVDANKVFTALNRNLDDITLVAASECKKLNRPFYQQYTPSIDVKLPGKFGRYYLYLTIMKSLQELKSVYLNLTETAWNPWEVCPDKTILLYAVVKAFGKISNKQKSADGILYYLDSMKEY